LSSETNEKGNTYMAIMKSRAGLILSSAGYRKEKQKDTKASMVYFDAYRLV